MRLLSAWYARVVALLMASLAAPHGSSAQDDPDTAAWREARQIGTYEAYQRYLEVFPLGRYADQAFRSMVEESLEQEFGADTEPAIRGIY